MILNTVASAVIVVERKGNIGSSIFRQFLQRLKSLKVSSRNLPDCGRDSRVAIDKVTSTYSVYSAKQELSGLFCLCGSAALLFLGSKSVWWKSVRFLFLGIRVVLALHFLVSHGMLFCVCWGHSDRDITTVLLSNLEYVFFYKRFAFPVWFAQTTGTFVAHCYFTSSGKELMLPRWVVGRSCRQPCS